MNHELPGAWEDILALLDHAFQPVVSLGDGSAWGYEALLRGHDDAGFEDIREVFDRAFEDRILYALDLRLREKAFRKFAGAGLGEARLFYNLDNRLLEMPDYSTGNTQRLALAAGLPPGRVVFEVSEVDEPGERIRFEEILASYRSQGFRIALDDFGAGYAGLKLLHRAQPDIVKIDRFFVEGSAEDPRKSAFVEKIVSLAHLMGIAVVAEGVETGEELGRMKEAGCDLVQGFVIDRPERDPGRLLRRYPLAAAAGEADRRSFFPGGTVKRDACVATPPVSSRATVAEVLARFRKDPDLTILPVVDGLSLIHI